MEPILVFTNFPDKKSALAFARKLIDQHLAACVNVLNECSSVYRWQSKIETDNEVPVLVKTRQQHYAQVEQLIKAMHPYDSRK